MPDLVAAPYFNWGRWVADCPRDCGGAEHHGPDRVTGHVGGLTDVMFACGECGLQCPVAWPAERTVIELVLAQRPAPRNRNWRPPETLHDLLEENIAHGVTTVQLSIAGPGGQ